MMRRSTWVWAVTGTILVALLLGRWVAVSSIEHWWAEALGFGGSQGEIARLQALLVSAAFVVAAAWCLGNLFVFSRSIASVRVHRHVGDFEFLEAIPRRYVRLGIGAAGLLLAILLSRESGGWWYHRALATMTTAASLTEPVLGRDLGFYLFKLPWWRQLHGFAFAAIASVLAVAMVVYLAVGAVRLRDRRLQVTGSARAHLGFLLAMLALVLYWGYRLEPLEYVGGIHEVPYDAVLVQVRIPTARMLGYLALLACVISGVWIRWDRVALPIAVWSILALVSVLGHYVVPAFAGSLRTAEQLELDVNPETWKQFAAAAYGVPTKDTAVTTTTPAPHLLRSYAAQLKSAPIWDAFAVLALLNRSATRPPFERFSRVHLARYRDADSETVPVYLAVRTLDFTRAGERRPDLTWTDVHVGPYVFPVGAVAVQANFVDQSGQPRFIADVAHVGMTDSVAVDVTLEDNRVVFGPDALNVAFVPRDDEAAAHGVPAVGFWRRVAFGWTLQSPRLVFGTTVSDDDRILLHRSVVARLERIAPFSTFGVPYPVIANERLYWLASGYVTAESFPLSARSVWRDKVVRSLRAGFVGVVDAVTGRTSVYLASDPDPVSRAWSQLLPDVVQPVTAIPSFLVEHLRYPGELFRVQAQMIRDSLVDGTVQPRSRVNTGSPEVFWWVGRGLRDPGEALRVRYPIESSDGTVLRGLLEGAIQDGRATLSLAQFAEPIRIPRLSELGATAAMDRPGSSSVVSGAVKPVLLGEAVGFLLSTYQDRLSADGSPALIEVVINWGSLVERGVSLLAALEGTDPLGSHQMVSASQWEEARQWFARMDAARRVNDWVAFSRAYDAFRTVLADSSR